MDVSELPNAVVSAVFLAGLYLLVGLGWVLLFRATQVLNFATGQFVLLGACLYYSFTANLHLPLLVSLLFALVLMAAVGAAVHLFLIRRVTGAEGFFAPVILTLGIATVITQGVNMVYGSGSLAIALPVSNGATDFPGRIAITSYEVITLVAGLSCYSARS